MIDIAEDSRQHDHDGDEIKRMHASWTPSKECGRIRVTATRWAESQAVLILRIDDIIGSAILAARSKGA
jgi:hypothetical protein